RGRPPPGLPVAELGREKSARRAQDRVDPAQLSVLPRQRPDPRRIRRRGPRPQAPVDLRLLSPAAQRVGFDPQLAAHLPAGGRHAGVLVLDQVQHQPDRPVTQLVRILPCCSHRPTLPWIGSLHKTRGDSTRTTRSARAEETDRRADRYALVSTSGQNLDRQTRALTEAGCIRVFADTLPGKTA